MKKKKILLLVLLILLIIPGIAFASGGSDGDDGSNRVSTLVFVIAIEAFCSIHISLFVLKPISELFINHDPKKVFWILFAIRAAILLIFDFFITPAIAMVDFFLIFIGGFVVVPVSKSIANRLPKMGGKQNMNVQPTLFNSNANAIDPNYSKVTITPKNFDPMYSLNENTMIEAFIERELVKAGIDKTKRLIPSAVARKKGILSAIFSVLVLLAIASIFFHFPVWTYLAEIVVLTIFFIVTRRFNLVKYLKKQLKARPGEKISNIVMNSKTTLVKDKSILVLLLSLIPAVVIPLVVFATPKIIYEKTEGGYAVRYYIYGLTNSKTATIPDTYNGEKVVSLRGNTFSNMFGLEKVVLPDTITEIRGQAFKNCYRLVEVNMPKNLQYLGGGAFNNATSIKRIELPDTLTELGGESFQGASSLEYVRLSNNLTEIRGNTFENCESLKEITIPDKVTRIGGHAFYGNISLEKVNVSENSKLQEIGSSAFRECTKLREITLPKSTVVNSKAFKASPTTVRRYNENDDKNNTNKNYNSVNELYDMYDKYLYYNNYLNVNADVTFSD